MGLKIALALGLVLACGGFAASSGMGAEIPYKTYSNVTLNTVGVWTRTEIHVPRGALMAITAQGECCNVKHAMKNHLDPSA